MLSTEARVALRDAAVDAWRNATRLTDEARELLESSRSIRGDAIVQRLEARRLADTARDRVERVIDDARLVDDLPEASLGVGLVAAHRIAQIGALHDTLHQRLGRVYAAGDAATAVGLAIVEQPDLAVIDQDLALMSGLDTARVLRAYAPKTGIVLITSEPEIDAEARREHIVTVAPSASTEYLLDAIDGFVATRDGDASSN